MRNFKRFTFLIVFLICCFSINAQNHNQEQPNEERFIDNKDGTITDNKTKLMWQKDDNGKVVTFQAAQEYVKNLRLGGYSDWRLPHPDEKDDAVIGKLIMSRHTTKGSADWYWSDDQLILLPFNYPVEYFYKTNLYLKEEGAEAFIRAVRSIVK